MSAAWINEEAFRIRAVGVSVARARASIFTFDVT